MDFLKKVLMFLGVLWLLGFVTMFALGYGVYSTVNNPEVQKTIAEASKSIKEEELRRHNEQMNREASYEVSNQEVGGFAEPSE